MQRSNDVRHLSLNNVTSRLILSPDVHRFDAHEIPFDGPTGIVARAERLLDANSSHLTSEGKRRALDNLVRIILQNA
jgi:hypothetical protein